MEADGSQFVDREMDNEMGRMQRPRTNAETSDYSEIVDMDDVEVFVGLQPFG